MEPRPESWEQLWVTSCPSKSGQGQEQSAVKSDLSYTSFTVYRVCSCGAYGLVGLFRRSLGAADIQGAGDWGLMGWRGHLSGFGVRSKFKPGSALPPTANLVGVS